MKLSCQRQKFIRFNPVGQITKNLSSPISKIFCFSFEANQLPLAHVLFRKEGRIAIVTERWSGMRWTRAHGQTSRAARTAKSCGPDASTLASSWR